MATIATWISDMRYDLRDFTGHDFDDTQLIAYLKRAIKLWDGELIKNNANHVVAEASVTQTSGNKYMSAPSNCDSIINIWRGQTLIYPIPYKQLLDRRVKFGTSTGAPDRYSHTGGTIYLDRDPGADTDYTVIFNQITDTSSYTTATSMPYSDEFNDLYRQAVLIIAQAAKKNNPGQADASIYKLFRSEAIRHFMKDSQKRPQPFILDF